MKITHIDRISEGALLKFKNVLNNWHNDFARYQQVNAFLNEEPTKQFTNWLSFSEEMRYLDILTLVRETESEQIILLEALSEKQSDIFKELLYGSYITYIYSHSSKLFFDANIFGKNRIERDEFTWIPLDRKSNILNNHTIRHINITNVPFVRYNTKSFNEFFDLILPYGLYAAQIQDWKSSEKAFETFNNLLKSKYPECQKFLEEQLNDAQRYDFTTLSVFDSLKIMYTLRHNTDIEEYVKNDSFSREGLSF